MPRADRVPAIPACAVALAIAIGCGGCARGQLSARETAQAWLDALNRGNPATVCGLYEQPIQRLITRRFGSCLGFFKRQGPAAPEHTFVLDGVQQDGDQASARFVDTATRVAYDVELRPVNGVWQLASLGPRPNPRPPPGDKGRR